MSLMTCTCRAQVSELEEPLFVREESCIFPEHVLYRIRKQDRCIKSIRWINLPVVDASSTGSSRLLAEISVAELVLVKVHRTSSVVEQEETRYFMEDGTSLIEYQKSMREESMKRWWESSEMCRVEEDKDTAMHSRLCDVKFRGNTLPDPNTISVNNTHLVYRGPCRTFCVPVYKKVAGSRMREEILYKHSHTRVLFKFEAFFRIKENPVVYKYGGDHVFYKSGRRLVGNPWFNTVPNEYILGVPFDGKHGQHPPRCPRFWYWYRDDVKGWSSIPID